MSDKTIQLKFRTEKDQWLFDRLPVKDKDAFIEMLLKSDNALMPTHKAPEEKKTLVQALEDE